LWSPVHVLPVCFFAMHEETLDFTKSQVDAAAMLLDLYTVS
jgi:hypothetical protein